MSAKQRVSKQVAPSPTAWQLFRALSSGPGSSISLCKAIFLTGWLALILLSGPLRAQQVYSAKSGTASFYSHAPLEDIEAKSKKLSAALDPAARKVAFSVPIRSFEFDKSLMQKHFNEKYMHSDKYPTATFAGEIAGTEDLLAPGTHEVTVKGKLKIHGVEKERTITGTVSSQNGNLLVNSKFDVRVADHNIEIPRLVFENIAEVVQVTVAAELSPGGAK